MKQTKRLFAVLVAVVMLLSAVPVMEASAATTVQITKAGQVIDTFNGVSAIYRTGLSDGSDATYSCAAYVKKYYNSVYGVNVWNLLTGETPSADSGEFSRTSSPEPGDIGYQLNSKNSGHWFIIKSVSGGTYTIIEQNWKWQSGSAYYCTKERQVTTSTSGFKAFRWSKKSDSTSSGHDPVGSVDYCEGKAGMVWLRGWVFDPDSYGSSINVHVYIGADSSAAGGEGHSIWADQERNDVNNVYGCGKNHGFDQTIETDMTGEQDVYIYAINVGAGSTKLLDVRTVTIADPSPRGSVDLVKGNAGSVTVDGWAFDPSNSDSAISIHVYIGDEGHNAGSTNYERADVNKAYGISGKHGFSFTVSTSKTGNQTVYVYAINIGKGGNRLIGTGTVNITPHTHSYTSKVTKAATCTADGVRTYTCACGASYTEKITKLGHSYGAWTKLNDTQHQRVCSRDSSHVEKANHTWNSGAVTKAATCTATGTKTYTCTVCNATKTETIAINASSHVNTKSVAAVASTCAVKGYTAGVYCNDCEKYVSGHAEQPLAAHTLTTQNAKAATCTAEGYTGDQVCTVCKQTISTGTAIAKKAHTITIVGKKDATYDEDGFTGDEYCTVCKQTIKSGTVIPKLEKPSDPTPTQPTQPQRSGSCKWCGKDHGGAFGWLVKIIHNILASIFGARY